MNVSYLIPIFAGTLLFVAAILLMIGDDFMKDIKSMIWLFGIFCIAIGIHIGMAIDEDTDYYLDKGSGLLNVSDTSMI